MATINSSTYSSSPVGNLGVRSTAQLKETRQPSAVPSTGASTSQLFVDESLGQGLVSLAATTGPTRKSMVSTAASTLKATMLSDVAKGVSILEGVDGAKRLADKEKKVYTMAPYAAWNAQFPAEFKLELTADEAAKLNEQAKPEQRVALANALENGLLTVTGDFGAVPQPFGPPDLTQAVGGALYAIRGSEKGPVAALTSREKYRTVEEDAQRIQEATSVIRGVAFREAVSRFLDGELLPGSDLNDVRKQVKTLLDAGKQTEAHDLLKSNPKIIAALAKKNTCPFANSNHAEAKSFGNVQFQVTAKEPWVQDLFNQNQLGAVRLSDSATRPGGSAFEQHQLGLRLKIPLDGKALDQSEQYFEVTANTGATTHATNGLDHTEFTSIISADKESRSFVETLANKSAGDVKAALGKLLTGNLLDKALKGELKVSDLTQKAQKAPRILELVAKHGLDVAAKQIVDVLRETKEEASRKFSDQEFYSRHTYAVNGRLVQMRVTMDKDTTLGKGESPFHSVNEMKKACTTTAQRQANRNFELDEVKKFVTQKPMTFKVEMKVLPSYAEYLANAKLKDTESAKQAYADLPNQENWADSVAPWKPMGNVTIPNDAEGESASAINHFKEFPFIPGGAENVLHGVGPLARDRDIVYLWDHEPQMAFQPGKDGINQPETVSNSAYVKPYKAHGDW